MSNDGNSSQMSLFRAVVTVALVAILVAIAAGGATAWIGTQFGDLNPAGIGDAFRVGYTAAAAVGAAGTLVVAYRRQQLLEEDRPGQRATQRALHERYQDATAQLGHDNPTIRLAGVYALAAVADDWLNIDITDQAQVCIDVLCAYQRTPAPDDALPGEQQVRQTITRVIAQHLQPDAQPSWGPLDFDFTGTTFTGVHDFSDAEFGGASVSFAKARFSGDQVSFAWARFSGSEVSFNGATFSAGWVSFEGATFSAGRVSFNRAEFSGVGVVRFGGATFSGGRVSFDEATFKGGALFLGGTFSDGSVSFTYAKFDGGMVSFDGATLGGDAMVSFGGAEFNGGAVSFDGVSFSGGRARFADSPGVGGGDRARRLREGSRIVRGPWPGPPAALPETWPVQ